MAFLLRRIRLALILQYPYPVWRSGTAPPKDLGLYLPGLDREKVTRTGGQVTGERGRAIRGPQEVRMIMASTRRLQALPREESLRLLRSVSVGRLVFTHLALPAIRPVNHVVEGNQVVIRAYLGTAIDTAVGDNAGMVVAYEADLIDPDTHLGWSVIIVGRASRLAEGLEADRYRRLLKPWVENGSDDVIAIRADMVDGFRLVS